MASRPHADAGWVHVRPLRQPAHPRGNQPSRPFHDPQIPEGSSSLPIIGRRSPASSSFVLAAPRLRALQLDPGPRDSTNRQRRGKPQQQSPQPGGPTATGHQARPPCLLTARAPMGAQTPALADGSRVPQAPVVSFIGLSFEPRAVRPPGSAAAVVPGHRGPGTGLNAGEHRCARRPSVHPAVSGLPAVGDRRAWLALSWVAAAGRGVCASSSVPCL